MVIPKISLALLSTLLAFTGAQGVTKGGVVLGSSGVRGNRELQSDTCPGGIPGIVNGAGTVCCDIGCGRCGGTDCETLPGGRRNCCIGGQRGILATADDCSTTGSAPCVISDGTSGLPTDPAPAPASAPAGETCPGGIPGIVNGAGTVCCDIGCGRCGGFDCQALPGGRRNCCIGGQNGILATADDCSTTGSAPCVISDGSGDPTPAGALGEVQSYLVTPPTEVMTIPNDPSGCTNTSLPTFRYAASSGKVQKGRLYAESPGCFTMTDIYNWRGTVSSGGVLSSKGPIFQLGDDGAVLETVGAIGEPVTNKWLLAAELYVTNGATFYCKGAEAGGDCDELRIQSVDSEDWYELRGHGGSLYFESTIVTSWDTPRRRPQTEHEGGRSFLNCVSEKLSDPPETCTGRAKAERGECRMDIIKSEMAYLGFFDSESYGLSWKVRGFCVDLSNHEIFTTTNVYGDIKDSDIHHNYYGHYSYGHQGGVWTNNKMHDNFQYGFDPHDDSDYLEIAHNEVYNNANHGIIASKRCNNVRIHHNQVSNGGPMAVGIFLHRSSDEAEVFENEIWDMQDAGIAFMESMNGDIHDNEIRNCRMGIRLSMGSAGNQVYNNVFDSLTDVGLNTYRGTRGLNDPTSGIYNIVRDGHPHENVFANNQILNTKQGTKFKDCQDLVLTGNVFTGTDELEVYDAQNTLWRNNDVPSSACLDIVETDDGLPIPISTFANDSDELPSEC